MWRVPRKRHHNFKYVGSTNQSTDLDIHVGKMIGYPGIQGFATGSSENQSQIRRGNPFGNMMPF
jgi:hypothetical protein